MRARPEGWVHLGLRGLFRKNTGDEAPSPETARPHRQEDPPAGPAADGPGDRGEDPHDGAAAQEPADDQDSTDGPRPLPEEGPVVTLVERLTSRGADRAVLTLVQRGSTMTHQTEQSVGDVAPSMESGTVDQDSPLFDPVADLYSEAMSSPRGAWRSARIEVGPEEDGIRPVVTTYGFGDGSQDVRTWQAGPSALASADGPDGTEPTDEQGPPESTDEQATPQRTAAAEPAAPDDDLAPATAAVPVVTEVDGGEGPAEPLPGTKSAAGTEPVDEPAAADDGEDVDEQDVPDHVDHEEWHEDVEPPAPTGGAAAAAAGTSTGGEQGPTAPETAASTDVAPSYRGPAGIADRPSEDRLADGNLVLKETDVLRRLAEAQRRLFGEDGTAMDVSTVLVRIRALGTYYDALTHVRKNGFWAQRRTFDLVPEELLHVQRFKEESYVEGAGAPLAMMFRFRPGIPPEVSFDYGDEEAFVRYEVRLPAQNYLEELRMYPRTGANIPQHMNEALQDWNY